MEKGDAELVKQLIASGHTVELFIPMLILLVMVILL